MTRQQRYPETDTFHFHNSNPRNRFTTDCVERAITTAGLVPYGEVCETLAREQAATGYAASSPEGFGRYLESMGWRKQKQPRKADGSKYTGKEFCRALQDHENCPFPPSMNARYVANIGGGHTVAIVNGQVWDTWDSTDGCIGNYWIK